MIKAILYDLDGVLVDACDWHYESLNLALKRVANYEISRQKHLDTFNGIPTKRKLEILKEMKVLREDQFDKVWKLKQEYTIDVIKQKAHFDGYKIKLHKYTKGIGIVSACVTNSIAKTASLMLEYTGQLSYMEFVVSNEDVKESKPSPMPYIYATHKLGLMAKDILVVEDSPKGIESAYASGCQVLEVKGCYDVIEEIIEKVIKEKI
jgi:HAD superfamily hydrolase (TIGR01509 family)